MSKGLGFTHWIASQHTATFKALLNRNRITLYSPSHILGYESGSNYLIRVLVKNVEVVIIWDIAISIGISQKIAELVF